MGRHGVARVDAQVEQGILQLRRIDLGEPQPPGAHHFQLDRRADRAAHDLLDARHQAVDVGGLGVQRLAAREGQQPLRERCGAAHRGLRHADVALGVVIALRGQALFQHLQAGTHAAQQVVEIVRDAARELADGFHLLRLAEVLLHLHQLLRSLGHLALQRLVHLAQLRLGARTLHGRARTAGDFAHEVAILVGPFTPRRIAGEKQRHEPALLQHWNMQQGGHAALTQGRQRGAGALVRRHVGDAHDAIGLEVIDEAAVMAQVQRAGHRRHVQPRPVGRHRGVFGAVVHQGIPRTAHAQGAAQELGGSRADVVGGILRAEQVGELRQRRAPPLGLHAARDVHALHEDPGDDAVRIADGLEHEVHVVLAHGRFIARTMGRQGLAAAIDAVKQLHIALREHLGQRLGEGQPDEGAGPHQAPVAGIGHHDAVLGPFEHGHEAGGLLEELGETLALGDQAPLCPHLGRGVGDQRKNPAGSALLVGDRRIVQVEPHRLRGSVQVQLQRDVLVVQRAACQAHAHHVAVEVARFRPGLADRQAQDARVTLAAESGVALVVKQRAALAPEQGHGHGRAQHRGHGQPQMHRPVAKFAHWRGSPVEVGDELAHGAAARQKGRNGTG